MSNRHLINPDPVDDAGKHSHRVGAPNHHHSSGSGGTPMVGNTHSERTTPTESLDGWVFARLTEQSHRFLAMHGREFTVRLDRLAGLVAEILAEHTAELRERCELAEGFIDQLQDDLNAAWATCDGGEPA